MAKYLTIQQAAEMLAVSQDTIRRMLTKLGAVDLTGGKGSKRLIRIPERALSAYLTDCEIYAPQPARKVSKADFKLERRRA